MHGKANGQGTGTRSDGAKYIGGWKDNKQHGQGTSINPGGQYTGMFKNGLFHGQGTIITIFGTWTGEWKDGGRVP